VGERGKKGFCLFGHKTMPFYGWIFLKNFIFYSNKGILVTLHPQNDVILDFPSIFTVSSNRLGGGGGGL
jgi:hypothetical protein